MRLLLVFVLLAACKSGGKEQHEPVSAVAQADWKSIESLATVPAASGAPTELARALEIAKTNGDAWREHMHDRPAPDMAAFAQGAEAITALKAWAAAKGGLPPLDSPVQAGVVALALYGVGELAVVTAKTADDIVPAEYLGSTLYQNGRSLLDAQIGTQITREAANKRKELGLAAVTAPKLDLVRVLAAEALTMRATSEYTATEQGRKELEAAAKQMPAHVSEKEPAGVDDLIPDEAERRGTEAFWAAALKGAQRGESTETTLARLQSATETAPAGIRKKVDFVPKVAKMIVDTYESANQPR